MTGNLLALAWFVGGLAVAVLYVFLLHLLLEIGIQLWNEWHLKRWKERKP